MNIEKYIIVSNSRRSYEYTYYKYTKYRLNKVSKRKKNPTIYVNEINSIMNKLSDEKLLKCLFYPRKDDIVIYSTELFFEYNGYDIFYVRLNTEDGIDIFRFNLNEICNEFSMIEVLSKNRDKFSGINKYMENMMLRFGCDYFSNRSRVNSIPGYYNLKN